jgi:hypothetical protein
VPGAAPKVPGASESTVRGFTLSELGFVSERTIKDIIIIDLSWLSSDTCLLRIRYLFFDMLGEKIDLVAAEIDLLAADGRLACRVLLPCCGL